MNRKEANVELIQRGFKFSHATLNGEFIREYWTRTDGGQEIFLDHSATITVVGRGEALISDFVGGSRS